jgi:hypothetical protein
MVNWKYIISGIIIMVIAYELHIPYNLIFGSGAYLRNNSTFLVEIVMFLVGFITIIIGVGKDK